MMRRLAPILIVLMLAIAAGCDGGNDEASTQPPPPATTSETGKAALERGVRSALSENAQNRKKRGVRVRMLDNTREILSLNLDPSYVRATAIVLDKQRVQPSGRNGRPLGRATKLNERARYELRRLGQTDQFVVWRVVLLR